MAKKVRADLFQVSVNKCIFLTNVAPVEKINSLPKFIVKKQNFQQRNNLPNTLFLFFFLLHVHYHHFKAATLYMCSHVQMLLNHNTLYKLKWLGWRAQSGLLFNSFVVVLPFYTAFLWNSCYTVNSGKHLFLRWRLLIALWINSDLKCSNF